MPIFELDGGRPVLVQPMQPAAGAFEVETEALVADHLGSLLNEQLFPVLRSQGAPGEPQVLALDAHGQPVVAEVVRVLDGDALVRALRHAGATSRLSTDDLARAYAGGPHAFADDLLSFRESLPIAVRHAPSDVTGARVVVFCAEVAENVQDAIDFLRQPGRQVDVMLVGVVRGPDGRRLLEVSPLGAQAPTRRPVEPASLRLVRSQDAFAEAMAYDASRPVTAERRLPRPTPDGRPNDLHVGAPYVFDVATGQHLIVTGQNPLVPTQARPAITAELPAQVPAGQAGLDTAGQGTGDLGTSVRDREGGRRSRNGTDGSHLGSGRPTMSAFDGTRGDRPLFEMARELGNVTLVWTRERRGERFEVRLRGDGALELPDGQVFFDPDVAAQAVSGSERLVDGWRTWRIGDHGPTLAEASAGV